jgi:hypothetical protein
VGGEEKRWNRGIFLDYHRKKFGMEDFSTHSFSKYYSISNPKMFGQAI